MSPDSDFSSWLDSLTRLPGLFMTGTDTDVGKTWVGVRLLQYLQQRGINIAPRKPVESGWPLNSHASKSNTPRENDKSLQNALQDDGLQGRELLKNTDAYQLAAACGQVAQLKRICPNRFHAPLSPPRAAQLEHQTVTINQLAKQCRHGLQQGEFLYAEGAGGFYSPLASDGLNADLAAALQLPVVLVSEDRVGCINHVLLSAAAIQARQLTLTAVILNPIHAAPEGMDNQTELQALLNLPILYLPN